MRRSPFVVMALAVVAAGCGGVEQEPTLATAIERTEGAGSWRFEVRGRLTDEGRELALRCDGAADYVRKRMRFACNDDLGEMLGRFGTRRHLDRW